MAQIHKFGLLGRTNHYPIGPKNAFPFPGSYFHQKNKMPAGEGARIQALGLDHRHCCSNDASSRGEAWSSSNS
jgi:hypothetical protein